MKTKSLSLLLAAAAVSVPVVLAPLRAHVLAEGSAESASLTETVSEPLARALDSIRADHIRADLHFIASDELLGRDTPSPGLRKAARFVRARLQRLEFTPAGSVPTDGGTPSYFHDYSLVSGRLDREGTHATLDTGGGPEELRFGRDYYFGRGGVAALSVGGDVAFVGSSKPSELGGLELSGRWALAYESEEIPRKELEQAVRAAGGLGLVMASEPGGRDKHDSDRAAGYAHYISRRAVMRVDGAEKGAVGFPTLFVSAKTAARMLGAVGDAAQPGQDLGVRLTDVRALQGEPSVEELENVCGLWPGSDPELAREVIVISAHYDHVGVEGEEIYNGADDNGSGTCGLMAIAEALKAHGPMKRSVLLLWVSGEEKGLLGSEAWARNPTLPDGMRAVCNLNIDMIGRNAPDYLLITPTSDHPAYNGLTRMAEKVAPLEGFPELGSCDAYWERSDHMNFSVHMGIPVAFLFSDVHADYHKPTDTVEKIDYDKIERVSRMVVRMLDELQDLELSAL